MATTSPEEAISITDSTHEHTTKLLPVYEYDVYLSYSGDDTQHRIFAGNLYNALRRKRFHTNMDEGEVKIGTDISPLIFTAIKVSRISIVVLSKNFAKSVFCLGELERIVECKKTINQVVLPIFYDVDPSDIRHQTGSVGDAFAYLERQLVDFQVLQRWRSALTEVACISGWHFDPIRLRSLLSRILYPLRYQRYEYELIEDIVKKVVSILPRYDVFLGFDEDTRYSFTDYLYNALSREGFRTFMKDRKLEDGNQTNSQDLVTAIQKARLSIIVFSKEYEYSAASLDELVTILDLRRNNKQHVWPIFYNVKPSDIRHQRKRCGKAMLNHERNFGKDCQRLQTWRLALFEVAGLKGWHLKPGYEYEYVEKIVEEAMKF